MLDVRIHAARSSRPPPDRVTVRSCIGCGARNLDRECTGECVDHKIELVRAADCERLRARVAAARRRISPLQALAEQLARSEPAPEEAESAFRDVQVVAHDALVGDRLTAEEAPAERIVAWWCATCGRIEAPQECIGVCVRRPEELVGAALYDEAVEQATAAHRSERRLAELASMVASVRPREGQWERNWRAMRARARVVLDAL